MLLLLLFCYAFVRLLSSLRTSLMLRALVRRHSNSTCSLGGLLLLLEKWDFEADSLNLLLVYWRKNILDINSKFIDLYGFLH